MGRRARYQTIAERKGAERVAARARTRAHRLLETEEQRQSRREKDREYRRKKRKRDALLKLDADQIPAMPMSLSFNHGIEEDLEETDSGKYGSTDIKEEKTD